LRQTPEDMAMVRQKKEKTAPRLLIHVLVRSRLPRQGMSRYADTDW
jgi:hypothetical protein